MAAEPQITGRTPQPITGGGDHLWPNRGPRDIPPAPGRFHMWAADDPDGDELPTFASLLGVRPPRVIRGYGGWDFLKRPGRWGATYWPGGDPPALEILLRLENRVVNTSDGTAGKMRRLERLSGWDRRPDPENPPPTVQWNANAPHHDYAKASQNLWVVESLEWDDDGHFADGGELLWWDATLVVGLYTRGTIPGLNRAQGFAVRVLHAGQDLRAFAKAHTGEASRWKDVAALNRDNPRCPSTPTHKVSKPVSLRVPPRESVKRAAKRARRR